MSLITNNNLLNLVLTNVQDKRAAQTCELPISILHQNRQKRILAISATTLYYNFKIYLYVPFIIFDYIHGALDGWKQLIHL